MSVPAADDSHPRWLYLVAPVALLIMVGAAVAGANAAKRIEGVRTVSFQESWSPAAHRDLHRSSGEATVRIERREDRSLHISLEGDLLADDCRLPAFHVQSLHAWLGTPKPNHDDSRPLRRLQPHQNPRHRMNPARCEVRTPDGGTHTLRLHGRLSLRQNPFLFNRLHGELVGRLDESGDYRLTLETP